MTAVEPELLSEALLELWQDKTPSLRRGLSAGGKL